MKRIWIIFIASLLWGQAAHAQFGLSNLVNPGPLSSPHKDLEGLKTVPNVDTGSGLPDRKRI
ncbi:MAG: hypothetical protein R3A11_07965 [Bdellovibrionota bacterium]